MRKLLIANLILTCAILCGCSFAGTDPADYIGEDAAVQIVKDEYALSQQYMTDIQVRLDEDIIGRDEYFVTFTLRDHNYQYEIDAVTGKVSSISIN